MKSYRPIRSNWMTQGWGENKTCIQTDVYGNVRNPVKVINKTGLVCPVGYKDFYKSIGMKAHNGVDWNSYHGEPVYFADEFDGWVRHEEDGAGGLGVDVVSHEPTKQCTEPGCNEKHYIKRRYWHGMDRGGNCALVGLHGRNVKMGDLVMYADNTGASSGDHVHTSKKWCDKNGVGIHNDNGFCGAFPDEEFVNNFVGDVVKLNGMLETYIGLLKSYIISLQGKIKNQIK